MEESVGEENFKGILKYDTTHTSSLPVTKQCPYNESQTVDRFCRKNFPYKAEWSEVDFSLCSPKTETTKKLLSLNQVGESLEDFSHFCNFFKKEPKAGFQLWKKENIANYTELIKTNLKETSKR